MNLRKLHLNAVFEVYIFFSLVVPASIQHNSVAFNLRFHLFSNFFPTAALEAFPLILVLLASMLKRLFIQDLYGPFLWYAYNIESGHLRAV